jgi:hypothetical protein
MKFKIVIEFDSEDITTADQILNLIEVTVDYCDLLKDGASVEMTEVEPS